VHLESRTSVLVALSSSIARETYLHGLDRIISFVGSLDRDPLDFMAEDQLMEFETPKQIMTNGSRS
jgi:hypothetical protein